MTTTRARLDLIFLSTPSARRATGQPVRIWLWTMDFYPRPPRGGRRHASGDASAPGRISIHALREEGDSPSCRRN